MSNSLVTKVVPVTPDDSNDLPDGVSVGIMVNVSGVVNFEAKYSDAEPLELLAGVFYPIRVKRVHATGTDANLGIHALYF